MFIISHILFSLFSRYLTNVRCKEGAKMTTEPGYYLTTASFQPQKEPITNFYSISSNVLGLGINGKVVECTSKKTGKKFALKVSESKFKFHFCYSNWKLSNNFQVLHDNVKARREVELHWRVSECKHIVNIIDVYENTHSGQNCLLVVMECMEGGELFQRIQDKQEGAFYECEAAQIMHEICLALKYLHDRNIAHRGEELFMILFLKLWHI